MKLVCTADWHLDGYMNDKINDESEISEKLNDIKKTITNIGLYCRENNITTIAVLGDLLHRKSIIHAHALSVLLDFFREFDDLKFIVIDGNHDLSSRGRKYVSALKALDNEPNILRIKEPTIIENIYFVPYGNDMIQNIKNNSCDFLMSHFGLNEATLNSGVSIIADIGIKDLKKRYKYVVLGHYHKAQEIIFEDTKVYYTGSPTELDWGEGNDNKRFLLIDTDNYIIESIPTIGYKKHINLEINNENKEEVLNKAKEFINEGHHVQLKKMDDIDISDFDLNICVIDKSKKNEDIIRGITSNMSKEEKLIKYLNINNINVDIEVKSYMNLITDIVNGE